MMMVVLAAEQLGSDTSDEAIVGAAVVVISWVWPYLVDFITKPDTPSSTKRLIAKVYSWIMGSGVVWAQTWLADNPENDLRSWMERLLLLGSAVFGVQGLTHVGHKMTKDTALRQAAAGAFTTPDSVEDLAPGDRIPRKLRKRLDAEEAQRFQEWQAAQNAQNIPPMPDPPAEPDPAPAAPTADQLRQHLEDQAPPL